MVPGVRDRVLPGIGIPAAALDHVDFTARFDTARADAALAGSGIAVPPLDRLRARALEAAGRSTMGHGVVSAHVRGRQQGSRPLEKANSLFFEQLNKVVDWHELPHLLRC